MPPLFEKDIFLHNHPLAVPQIFSITIRSPKGDLRLVPVYRLVTYLNVTKGSAVHLVGKCCGEDWDNLVGPPILSLLCVGGVVLPQPKKPILM